MRPYEVTIYDPTNPSGPKPADKYQINSNHYAEAVNEVAALCSGFIYFDVQYVAECRDMYAGVTFSVPLIRK